MPKHSGVYKKGKKWYGAKWWKGKTYVTRLCKTAEKAAHLREKLIKRLRKGLNVEKSNITVANFIELYLENYITKRPNVHKMTIDSIKSGFKTSIIPIIGHLKLKDLNPEIMQILQNKLLEKYAPGTVKVRINDFKRVIRRAVIWHYLPYDPSIDLDSVIVDYDTEKPDILSPEQFKLIFQSNEISLREKAFIGCEIFAGMRESEIVALTWERINFIYKYIDIRLKFVNGYLKPPKKKSIRQVPIFFKLEPILKEWKLQCPSPKWVFPGRKGMPMNAGHWARKNFREILRMLDLPLVRFHSLRHAFDVMMHDLGVPTRELCR